MKTKLKTKLNSFPVFSLDILINFGIRSARLKTGGEKNIQNRGDVDFRKRLNCLSENLKNSKIFENKTG